MIISLRIIILIYLLSFSVSQPTLENNNAMGMSFFPEKELLTGGFDNVYEYPGHHVGSYYPCETACTSVYDRRLGVRMKSYRVKLF